jgi:type VI protein secretion system component VasK
MEPRGPKTLVRPPGRRPVDLPALARPLIDLAGQIERAARPDPAPLARELRTRVGAFESAAHAAGLASALILDARDALIAVVDARARANPALDARRWAAALRAALPAPVADGASIAAAAARADRAGARELARFLAHCREAVASARPAARAPHRWPARLAVAGFGAILLAWAGWAEWQHRVRLLATLPDLSTAVAEAGAAPLPVRAARLDIFAAAVARVERDATGSPLGIVAHVPWLDPAAAARARYDTLASALVPGPVAEAIGVALATEGEATDLYDSLRAAAILEGRAPWQPRFLAGWVEARAAAFPGLAGVAPHVAAMRAAPEGIAVSDLETRAEAQRFAGQCDAADRAYLELARSDAAGALPDWTLDAALPAAVAVLVRRSATPVEAGVPGLFTVAGWEHARAGGAAAAVERAAAEGATLVGAGQQVEPDAVLDRLQAETLAAWRAFVADLRVRPFTDQAGAVMTTGILGVRDTPLTALIREVWREAGGEDRTRSHANQLRIAAEFGPAIQFVEQGRMDEIAQVFASLNVVLQVVDADADIATRQLMDVQARAASIAALNRAPRLVVEIIEDVLAQTAVSSEGRLGNRALSRWQSELGPACDAAVAGRYPFGEGVDADPATLARLLGPAGEVPRFFAEHLAGMMDAEATPWRWKPEGRLSGLTPESAAFFERIAALAPVLDAAPVPVTLTALAQRGAPTVAIGGAGAPVVTSGEPVVLTWPGPAPERGFEIAFDSGARGGAAGPWGMLRYFDGLRLRPRLEGQRFLVDARLADARAYLQLDFEGPRNPIALRALMRGLSCPPVL